MSAASKSSRHRFVDRFYPEGTEGENMPALYSATARGAKCRWRAGSSTTEKRTDKLWFADVVVVVVVAAFSNRGNQEELLPSA